MLTQNLGYPRIGDHRELKRACEKYWAGELSHQHLIQKAREIKKHNWQVQQEAGIDLIPCNDFSFYDQVLDMSLTVNAIPRRFLPVAQHCQHDLDIYFAMARGYQQNGLDVTAMEMTKWFDTNYHYLVPEFYRDQSFSLFSNKVFTEFHEAKETLGRVAKPVLIGPVSYLLLGKEKEDGFHRLDLLERLLPVYEEILHKLAILGAEWIQFDEPFLVMDLTEQEKQAFDTAYKRLKRKFPYLRMMVATFFECTGSNIEVATQLPVEMLHLDLVRCPCQLEDILQTSWAASGKWLSLGVVDGRNIWINHFEKSLQLIHQAEAILGKDRLVVAPSCSLLHVPCDLALEADDSNIPYDVKNWMAFAKQKLDEVVSLKALATDSGREAAQAKLAANKKAWEQRSASVTIHRQEVKDRVAGLTEADATRASNFQDRQQVQKGQLRLPPFPTTTIGSFPQTTDVRVNRAQYKKGNKTREAYESFIREATEQAIRWQEEVGLDVLVHGEFERNDMVEYFGELLHGFAFSKFGWVQSYGSRCVKPPIIYGDVWREYPMTVEWTRYAQSLTEKPVKGMLTGPVTILQWSFVRDDQPRKDTCWQIALAIRDEVQDLEAAGIKIIQIDEPAVREGLPLRKEHWSEYLTWAVKAFKIAASGVQDQTQIHTHMCYAEFNDIIQSIAAMDADVITIETSRSQMELLQAFSDFAYPNEIGPGVYDIHSPRVPTVDEMVHLLEKATAQLPAENIWVNPDCGLKTRNWQETEKALRQMVAASKKARENFVLK